MKAYQQSLKYYTELESHYPQFEGIHESRYYAGQSHYLLENYRMVLIINDQISKKSEFYPYGMYTVALANLKKKNVKQSIENFQIEQEKQARVQEVDPEELLLSIQNLEVLKDRIEPRQYNIQLDVITQALTTEKIVFSFAI